MSSKTKLFLQRKRTSSFISKDSKKISQDIETNITKGPWTEKEDQLLRNWVQKHGPCNWTKCSEYVKGRTGKQCREHWNNSLDPQLTKGQWTPEEDLLIMIFYKKYDGSWKRIIPIFERRTENSIKNRFFSQLRKIASKYNQTGKKEYSTKFGLDMLLKYLDEGTNLAKKKFFGEKIMNEKELNDYINKIDNLVKNRNKGDRYIDLKILKDKKNNKKYIDIKEDDEKIIKKNQNMETVKKRNKRGRKKKSEKKNEIPNIFEKLNTNEETIQIKDNINLNKNSKNSNQLKRTNSSKIHNSKNIVENNNLIEENNNNDKNKDKDKKDNKNNDNNDKNKDKPLIRKSSSKNFKKTKSNSSISYNINNNENDIKNKNEINNSNNNNNININNESNNNVENNIYNQQNDFFNMPYKIKPYNKNKDYKKKDTFEDLDLEKQSKNEEKKAIRHCNNLYDRRYINSTSLRNKLDKGYNYVPIKSFDNMDKWNDINYNMEISNCNPNYSQNIYKKMSIQNKEENRENILPSKESNFFSGISNQFSLNRQLNKFCWNDKF